jgi:D-alanyl-D-alanine-carboxypeptidase/D-alanyl-D-alanine-endopeptidase
MVASIASPIVLPIILLAGDPAASTAAAPPDFTPIEAHLEKGWKDLRLPSLSAAVVLRDGPVLLRAFGFARLVPARPAAPDTLYRIGSVTKVFTATLLVVLRDRGALALDDPVDRHLPPGVRLATDPRGAPAITLRHLATHASGLPRLPVNLAPRGTDPYGGFAAARLLEGLPRTPLDAPAGARYAYSNLGFGVLGLALERASGKPYGTLLEEEILRPLGMTSTRIGVREEDRPRLAAGYGEGRDREAEPWDLGCLAPAGGIICSAADLAKFLALELRAGEAGVRPVGGGSLRETQTPQRLTDGWKGAIGLGWHVRPLEESWSAVWHNGRVGGFTSYMALCPERGVAVALLANCGRSVDDLGLAVLIDAVRRLGTDRPRDIDPRVRRAAEALVARFGDGSPDSLEDLFHPQFLAEIPLAGLRPYLAGIGRRYGSCTGVEVTAGEKPRAARLTFRFPGRTLPCDIEVDPIEGKIVHLFFPEESPKGPRGSSRGF